MRIRVNLILYKFVDYILTQSGKKDYDKIYQYVKNINMTKIQTERILLFEKTQVQIYLLNICYILNFSIITQILHIPQCFFCWCPSLF